MCHAYFWRVTKNSGVVAFLKLGNTLPLPPLPSLEVGPLNPARKSGSAVSSLSGVWVRAPTPVEIEFGAH